MRILKIYGNGDVETKYNYQVNYNVWDKIEGKRVYIKDLGRSFKPDEYDVILLPMYKRWTGNIHLLDKIKNSKAKSVLFDNDSNYRTFDNSFYADIDFVFYRCPDKNGNTPNVKSSFLPWSVNESLYTPSYGGDGVSFLCSVSSHYPLRGVINKLVVKNKGLNGKKYIEALRISGASIHTDSPSVPYPRSKILEMAACGTQIISNKTNGMDHYFPDRLITYFDSIEELKSIVESFTPDVSVQKELRSIVEEKHTSDCRAKYVMDIIKDL